MFKREQLQGILLTIARPEITIYRSDKSKSGYTVRVRVMFRAGREFLIALQRTLEQYTIKSILREKEGSNRASPVLIVGQKTSLSLLRNLMPGHPNELPCSHSNWDKFDLVTDYLSEGLHLEEGGMDRLMREIENVEKHTDNE
tara:strand:+ start:995 stop:1423 length:429 start_codon:yes stop_codon:yes gene_type:complete